MNGAKPAAMFALGLIFGIAVLLMNWDAIDKENNAFAKDFNDRGGMVIFGMHARQCIGADKLAKRKD